MAEAKSFKDLPLLYNKGASSALRANTYPDDARDVIPITHAPNTTEQQDYAVPLSQIGVSTVGTCDTSADTQTKVVDVISGSFPFNTENSDEAIGRNILVKFTNGNIAENPKIKIGNIEAKEIVCIGGTATVGSGCWEAGATMKFTFDGENWLMHSNVAQKTNDYTILADGTTVYNKTQIDANNYTKTQTDSAINGALANLTETKIEIVNSYNANDCVSTDKFKSFFIQGTSATPSINTPITDKGYNWHIINQTYNLGANRLRASQIATTSDGSNPNYTYTRNGSSNDNGVTWNWGNWEKIATESDIQYSFQRGQNNEGVNVYGVKSVTLSNGTYFVFTHDVGVSNSIRIDIALVTANSIILYNVYKGGTKNLILTVNDKTITSSSWINTFSMSRFY